MRLVEMGDIRTGKIVLGLVLPELGLWKRELCDFGDSYRKAGLSLPSKLFYNKTECFEMFTMCLLGLGFYVSYQKGY